MRPAACRRGWTLAYARPCWTAMSPSTSAWSRWCACLRRGWRRPPLLQGCPVRSEEHTSELQSLMRISYAVFCLKKKNQHTHIRHVSFATLNTHQHQSLAAITSYYTIFTLIAY